MTTTREQVAARRAAIAAMWQQKHTRREIAEALGMTSAAVGRDLSRMREAGVELESRGVDMAAVDERDAKIIALWKQGLQDRQIADSLQMQRDQVKERVRALRRRGVELESRSERAGGPSPIADQIQALWNDGRTTREIADEVGLTDAAISTRISRMRQQGRDLQRRR